MSKVMLNLGCYDKKLPDYINVDIRPECNPDVVDDAFKLEKFDNDSVDLIYTSHMLEHLTLSDAKSALDRFYVVLKPGGILRISVPDFDAIVKRYIYTGDFQEVQHLLYGSQKHKYDFHYNAYTFDTLSNMLRVSGFREAKRWNWWEITPHRYTDDFSRAYLPHDKPDIALSHGRYIKSDGMLMSLNVEAAKCNYL